MKLSKQDADLFFFLLHPLQLFVAQRLQRLPHVKAYHDVPPDERLPIRDAVYEHPEFIDAFIQENPYHFSEDQLAIISGWKRFVADDFYIERFLKKHAIFISSSHKVYAVLGLYEAFDEMIHRSRLPFFAKAVLLPFKDKIVYDGMLQGYNMFFGRGISSNLKETYMAAKQHGGVIESLMPASPLAQSAKPKQPVRNWRPELDELISKAKKLRASSDHPPMLNPSFSLVKASLEFAQSAIENPNDLERLYRALKKVERATGKVEIVLNRADRYLS